MIVPFIKQSFLSHSLFVRDPEASLTFYQKALGMMPLAQCASDLGEHFYLGYPRRADESATVAKGMLELIHRPPPYALDIRQQPDPSEGYWKFSIAVADIDAAYASLCAYGAKVAPPFQVPDVAYLCHLQDPDGYCIELIQHTFQHNHSPAPLPLDDGLGSPATFSLSTYRIKDPVASLRFYRETLGMRLLSRQPVPSRGMTLYFLAYTDELPPHEDLEAVGNREWLWQRPYTQVELQHIWGTEQQADFHYRVGDVSGFDGINLLQGGWEEQMARIAQAKQPSLQSRHPLFPDTKTITLKDPDGYSVRLIDGGARGALTVDGAAAQNNVGDKTTARAGIG